MYLTNGVGVYRFGRNPEAPIKGKVTTASTGWILTGSYGSGDDTGTIRLEQDSSGRFNGRWKGSKSGSGTAGGSCQAR